MAHPGTLMQTGRLEYTTAWALQRALVAARISAERPDTLWLLEHDPVFTIGRRGEPAHWGYDERRLTEAGYPVYHVERGGSITYHGPGQIVGYPIVRLANFCAGPSAYIRALEEVLIRTLADWGVSGRRVDKCPGVWVERDGRAKVAAMGVKIQRGVTMHGFALNVSMDLHPFAQIIPCGLEQVRVTSMAEVLGRSIPVADVRDRISHAFAEVFGVTWTEQIDEPRTGRMPRPE